LAQVVFFFFQSAVDIRSERLECFLQLDCVVLPTASFVPHICFSRQGTAVKDSSNSGEELRMSSSLNSVLSPPLASKPAQYPDAEARASLASDRSNARVQELSSANAREVGLSRPSDVANNADVMASDALNQVDELE
jgi:hypothetical protein